MRDRLIEQAASRPDWVLGFQDETWWTRLSQPDLFAWAGEQPLRLLSNERGGGKECDPGASVHLAFLLESPVNAASLRVITGDSVMAPLNRREACPR